MFQWVHGMLKMRFLVGYLSRKPVKISFIIEHDTDIVTSINPLHLFDFLSSMSNVCDYYITSGTANDFK